jgi:hypothetical protein
MKCGTVKGRKYEWRVLWDEDRNEAWIEQIAAWNARKEYVGKAHSVKEAIAAAMAKVMSE